MNKPATPVRRRNLVRAGTLLACVILALVAIWSWHRHSADAGAGGYRTATIDRGDIRVAISATGTLSAISTVDVGSQISGQVTAVRVDFNDHVSKGEVLARIDPSTYQAQIAQGSAAVGSARANLASAQATLRNAEADYARKAELAQQQLVARSDADLARAARDQARAQADAAQAQITQQQASTQTSQLNLQRTVIRSPVDGVVVTRTVEPGQTVAASLQAPVLFQIAEDLSKMQIILAVDEADIGQVKAGQLVSFSVDAFPDRQYRGSVQQVRLSATNTNNVITYPVVVAVDNSDRSLLPGMTANAEIEVSRRSDVLRVPNSALRFKPADEDTADAQAPQPGARGGAGMGDELPKLAGSLRLDPRQQAAFDAALAAMKQRAASRRTAPPAAAPSAGASLFGGRGGQQRRNGGGDNANQGAMRQRMLERMTQQFGAFRATLTPAQQQQWDSAIAGLASARRAPLYLLVAGKPKQVMVRIGASDGTDTEVSGDIHAGDPVIVGAERATPSP
ncbi:MAG TPA: efflux RND transporter periplasmic adaptor subunit [Luteimonas sp.]|nr:efflux RND transporter periplasmic adaptor subunit [Luteimonas sp.]